MQTDIVVVIRYGARREFLTLTREILNRSNAIEAVRAAIVSMIPEVEGRILTLSVLVPSPGTSFSIGEVTLTDSSDVRALK